MVYDFTQAFNHLDVYMSFWQSISHVKRLELNPNLPILYLYFKCLAKTSHSLIALFGSISKLMHKDRYPDVYSSTEILKQHTVINHFNILLWQDIYSWKLVHKSRQVCFKWSEIVLQCVCFVSIWNITQQILTGVHIECTFNTQPPPWWTDKSIYPQIIQV